VAYVRTKTINGVTYDYLVKSVRDGKKVRQVFVRYIGKHPPGAGQGSSGGAASGRVSSRPGGFQALCGADARTRCVALFYDLGCQRVVFSLRSNRRHGAVHTLHYPETGKIEISKVRLHREASMEAVCHEVGHVLDTVLQKQNPSSGSLSPEFEAHMPALRIIADYTCVDQAGGSPQFRRQLRRDPPSKERDCARRTLERYYETYVYRADELFARLVSVSLCEPHKAHTLAPAAYQWLLDTLYSHAKIRHAFGVARLWAK